MSIRISRVLVHTPITPNMVTFLSLATGIAAGVLFVFGTLQANIIASLLAFLSYVLDYVDGQIARLKKLCSKTGEFFDGIVDRLTDVVLIFGITFGLYLNTGDISMFIYGFIFLSGTFMTFIVTATGGATELNTSELTSLRKNLSSKFSSIPFFGKIKPTYFALTKDLKLFILIIGVIADQLLYTFIFLSIAQNLFWLGLAAIIWNHKQKGE